MFQLVVIQCCTCNASRMDESKTWYGMHVWGNGEGCMHINKCYISSCHVLAFNLFLTRSLYRRAWLRSHGIVGCTLSSVMFLHVTCHILGFQPLPDKGTIPKSFCFLSHRNRWPYFNLGLWSRAELIASASMVLLQRSKCEACSAQHVRQGIHGDLFCMTLCFLKSQTVSLFLLDALQTQMYPSPF